MNSADTSTSSERRSLRVSEVFDSLQGEGVNTGAPCRFIRLALCNLRCSYCDTKYTWDFDNYSYTEEVHERSVEELAALFREAPARHVVLTGGEPLLQQRELELVFALVPESVFIEIETNGTVVPSPALRARVNQWNVSPKLANSGDPASKRIRPSALAALRDTGRAYLKLVVSTARDRDEAEALRREHGFVRARTLLMPEATTPAVLEERGPLVAGFCSELGLRYSTRLHVALWGGRRGT